VLPAVELAISHINIDTSILPLTLLNISSANTRCSADIGLQESIDLLNESPKPHAIVGAGCSSVCETVSIYSKIKATPLVSYACTSPIFSDQDNFPFFVRTSVTDESYADAWIAICLKYGYKRVATISETKTISTNTIEAFQRKASLNDIEVVYHGILSQGNDGSVIGNELSKVRGGGGWGGGLTKGARTDIRDKNREIRRKQKNSVAICFAIACSSLPSLIAFLVSLLIITG
jgi:ABC-type branched-subunit amino acid transport system substrate-binding protein